MSLEALIHLEKILPKLGPRTMAPQILRGGGSSGTGAWKASGTAAGERALTLESRNEKTEVAEFIL